MSLNIGGSEDQFYRYKMPDLQVKIEGRGNGIKTVIPNMGEIALALKRDPGYPTKYFATELGAVSMWDDKRNVGIVNGKHEKATLAKLLADFINRYVLCPQCHYPETDLKIKKGTIYAQCRACSFYGLSDNHHKLATYILKHPPNSNEKKEKDDKDKEKDKKDKKEPKGKGKNRKKKEDEKGEENGTGSPEHASSGGSDHKEDEDEDGEMEFEITEEMKKATIDDSNRSELADPVQLMRTALAAGSDLNEKLENVVKLQKEQLYSDFERLQYFIKAIVNDNMTKQIKSNIDLLRKFVGSDRESQMQLFACIEVKCETDPAQLKRVSTTLMALYDADILTEKVILDWYEKGVSHFIALADFPARKKTREAAKEFIEWLQSAEEEESENDE
eukprot:c18983_g1_i3.p1 GENE.c18983_g1_i3~~c18983_g1_i3.p1  ORF type:complete len:389 (+),score=144.21 c18983_g1_i3:160-1326(+)